MQVWDANGARISSRRLAGEADLEYVLWKDPNAAVNDDAYFVKGGAVSHSYTVYTCWRLIDLSPILHIHAGD